MRYHAKVSRGAHLSSATDTYWRCRHLKFVSENARSAPIPVQLVDDLTDRVKL